jgi:hypothetical protein
MGRSSFQVFAADRANRTSGEEIIWMKYQIIDIVTTEHVGSKLEAKLLNTILPNYNR